MITRDIEKYSHDYLDEPFEEIMVKYRRKKVLEILDRYKPENVLEIGCGVDSIVNYYKNYQNFVIVEPSSYFVKKIRQSDFKNLTIINDFVENKIDELKKFDFDFVLISALLHEIISPDDLIEKVKQLLNKDTILHINVPNSQSFHLLWAYESGLIPKLGNLTDLAKKLQQNTTFNLDELSEFLSKHDLEILDKGSYFIKPFNHLKMAKLMKLNFIDDKLLDGLYKMVEYMPNNGAEIFVNCKLSK